MAKRSEAWKARRERVLPGRMDYAKRRFAQAGISIVSETSTSLIVRINCFNVRYSPFTGGYTGKSVGSGRGIDNLINLCKK